ncbi:Aspergillopepsin-1-like protein 1 [Elsinoe fawcettii]|nr:Aspergillopepsin-1-like protein 1 [Elsinoe fawcettii]
MHFTTIVAAASVATVALAAPAPLPVPENHLHKRSFKVERLRNANATRDPKTAMRKAFEKHGMHLIILNPDGSSATSAASGTGSSSGSSGLGSSSGSGRGSLTGSSGSGLGSLGGSSGSGFPGFGSSSGSDGSNADRFRSWLSSYFASATPRPQPGSGSTGSGSGSSGSGSGVDQPAPAEPSATPVPDTGSGSSSGSNNGNAASPTPTASTAPSAAPSAAPPAAGSGTGETGEATTNPYSNGAFYLTPVSVGGQTLNLNLDTGSADLWVFDKSVLSKGFDKSASSSFKPLDGYSFKISYGDGSSASGTVGTDTVSIGKAVVSNQAVELATTASAQFQRDTKTDGLLGLGFSNTNSVRPKQQKTFFDNIKEQLSSPLFTVTLNEAGEGEYEFGKLDQEKYSGEIHYADVDSSRGYWQFTSTSFQIGGKTVQNSAPSPAIADTGTSLCLVDTNVAQAYYAQVQGAQYEEAQGGYVYPCDAELPTFGVALGDGGYYVTIPGNQITYAQAGGGQCFGGIQPNQGQKVQIYGDALLKEKFVVFDGQGPRVGFADRTGNAMGSA